MSLASTDSAEIVVIGSGPNGLVAANHLAEAGLEVLVLEAQPTPGGAVRSGEVTLPGYTHDLFSAFYPLAIASPVMADLELERYGLEWARADVVVAHPTIDGTCAAISLDLEETCASLDAFAPADGDAWRELYAQWQTLRDPLLESLFRPFPPVGAGARLLGRLRHPRRALDFARFSTLSARRLGQERFGGMGGRRLLAGNALHADLSPDSAAGGLYGWLLCAIAQELGWPVAVGGASGLSGALVRRLESLGGEVRCSARVSRIRAPSGRAEGVELEDGSLIGARRAVLANSSAPALYGKLLDPGLVPARLQRDLDRFQWDNGTVKVNWAMSGPVPFEHELARRAGTVHVTEGVDELGDHANQLAAGLIPEKPFSVLGQYSRFDPSRAPDGCEAAWAYTHVPQRVRGDGGPDGLTGAWNEREGELFADRMEREIETVAPGFRDLIQARDIMTPVVLEAANENLVGGAINAGTAQIHQQLVFRPTPGGAGPGTPVEDLYLASASAHPGGGVHGAAGANAAAAVLRKARGLRPAFLRSKMR